GLGVASHSDDLVALVEIHQTHTHGGAARLLDLVHTGADDPAVRGDREELVLLGVDSHGADDLTASLHDLGGQHTLAAPVLQRVLVGGRALAVPVLGSDLDVGGTVTGPDDVHGQQVAASRETHTDHAAGGPAHRPQRFVRGREPDRLRVAGDHQQVVLGEDQAGGDEFVALAQIDRDDPGGTGRVEVAQAGFLHQTVAGCQDQVRGGV